MHGLLPQPIELTMDAVRQTGVREVEVLGKGGEKVRYKGVNLSAVLKEAGAPLGEALRGQNMAQYLVVRARDGYRVVFSLAEIDPALTDQVVLLAFLSNGEPLGPGVGPFRLVVPQDKRQARWVREVTDIEVKIAKE
ncbi:molybdopterin-dependent oxidoreductase [Cyclobacterium xiamenense]|uniref:molybdopterin-dependent oxidoreductase n=1 Tax=Cyclobacterium xiamenense TaxID=1297121 RepID=UPI0035CF9807